MKQAVTIVLVALFVALSGCSATVQSTSGKSYLEKYSEVPAAETDVTEGVKGIDQLVREAASVEPVLRFPARIGLARIGEYGRLSAIPEAEAEHWMDLKARLGGGYGDFVPINPLVAALTNSVMTREQRAAMDTVDEIRLAAARQHLDAVLIYEVSTSRQVRQNALAATDFTLITAFVLPTRKVKGVAVGNALLIDVIQGYPYGTAQADIEERKMATLWGVESKTSAMNERMRAAVTQALTDEAEIMFRELRLQIAELD